MKISCSCRPRLQIATISSASLRSTRSTRTGAPRTSVVNGTVSLSLRCLRCLLLVMYTHPFAKKALTLHLARSEGCLRCLLLVMCTYPFAKKKALTIHLARGEGRERYFGCNLMQRKVLASSHQHLMAEAPRPVPKLAPFEIDHKSAAQTPLESAQNRRYFAPQGWLSTPGLRVASDRPTGGAHGWLKSAAGRACRQRTAHPEGIRIRPRCRIQAALGKVQTADPLGVRVF